MRGIWPGGYLASAGNVEPVVGGFSGGEAVKDGQMPNRDAHRSSTDISTVDASGGITTCAGQFYDVQVRSARVCLNPGSRTHIP